MGRLHIFEIEDFSWCPRFIREGTTDILLALYKLLHIYDPAYKKIAEVLDKTQLTNIVDCCSGSGGPITQLREYLDKNGKSNVSITLTDKYPNVALYKALESRYGNEITGRSESISAAQLPANLTGMRTLFSSFHHFRPQDAIKILQDAVNNNSPIAIFESVHRQPADFMRALFSPILAPFIIPFSQRLNWRTFLFTYIIPIIPITFTWDYFASNMRSYSVKEMQNLVTKVHAPDYDWEIGKVWSSRGMCYVSYLIGQKK